MFNEQTANTEEEILPDSSSSEQEEEIALESLSQEELLDFAKRERDAKRKAIDSLRNQAKKRHTIEDVVQSHDEQEETDAVKNSKQAVEALRDEAKRMVQEEHRQARISEYSAGSTDWLKSQAWAEEMNKSDQLYGQFSKELKRLAETQDVHSQTAFRNLMRLAAVNVTGKPDPLMDHSADEEVASDKQKSVGYRPSQSVQSESFSGFNERERQIIERANTLRVAAKLKPLTPKDILKK